MSEATPFFRDRAAEIIAAYGGNPARWPDAERATALAVIAADPGLATALAEARTLDGDLADWARRPVRVGDTHAVAAVAMRRPAFARWATGGSIAASVAAAILLLTPARMTPSVAPQSVAVAAVSVSDEAAFAHVFTPTPDEENIL